MSAERKLVTVIFVDIVGSTELGESHDPEVIRATLSRAFTAASEILEDHGGTVEKFIGDAVMAVFGVPNAHDDDAERAVRAAFALRARLSELVVRPVLQLRIGIDSGEAVAGTGRGGQHLVTGSVVNSAARLQSSAEPGQIRVGSLTQRLTRQAVRYAPPTTIVAKGLGVIESWLAEALLTAVPDRHHGVAGLTAPLIGREAELQRLMDVYRELEGTNAARLLTVFGPPGVGKSRLTNEFLAMIGTDRSRVGRCLPYGRGTTNYAIQLIVRADTGIAIDDSLETAITKIHVASRAAFSESPAEADAVGRRVSVLTGLERAEEALPGIALEQLRDELNLGIRRFLERRAGDSPLVLVFEDIQWAEPGLLQLIRYLAEWSRAPLMLLCLARTEFLESSPTWGESLPNAMTVVLSPLTNDETRTLIEALLSANLLPESLVAQVVDRVEGNPLFVEEFLRVLIETGQIQRRDGRWIAGSGVAEVDVPPTLLGLITARLDLVSEDLKKVLQRGSLAGRLFTTSALAALGDGSRPDAALMREAVRRDLLVEVPERAIGSGSAFRFKHVLIRDVAYSTVPKAERSRLHDRYGRWLEASLGDRTTEVGAIVAYHAQQAYRFANELDAPDTEALGRRALILISTAAEVARDSDDAAALDLYERASAIATAIRAAPSELAELNGYIVVLRRQIATEQRPIAELDEAVDAARSAGLSRVLVDLLILRAFEAHRFGLPGKGSADEALAVASETGDPELVAEAMWTQVEVVYLEGDVNEMQRVLADALAYIRSSGAKRARDRIYIWASRLARYRGELSQVARYREESVAASSGTKENRAIAAFGDCRFALAVGDTARAVTLGLEALALMREVGRPHFVGLCCLTLGDAFLAAGDAAAAHDLLAEGLDVFVRRQQLRQIPELAARAARACVRLGRIAQARAYAEQARATALATDAESRYITAVALAEVAEAEGDVVAADAAFRDALAILEATTIMDALAFVRETYAEFLLRHGRGAEARANLEAARKFHDDPLGERNRQRIDALLQRTVVTA